MSLDNLINKECIICFEMINNENEITNIFEECNHNNEYHLKCANDWINTSINNNIIPSCPLCRNQLNLIDIPIDIPIQNNQNGELNSNNQRSKLYKTLCCFITISFSLSIMFYSYIKH